MLGNLDAGKSWVMVYLAGEISYTINLALQTNNSEELIKLLKQFGEDPVGLFLEKTLPGVRIIREPDPLWEEFLVNSSANVNYEMHSIVSLYKGEFWLRWTIPRSNFYFECTDINKLVHAGLVIIEELLHFRQLSSLNTRSLLTLCTSLDLGDISKLETRDNELLCRILESDVTHFLLGTHTLTKGRYIENIEDTLWYKYRQNSELKHKPMSSQEFVNGIIDLAIKYGDFYTFVNDVVEDFDHTIASYPEICMCFLRHPRVIKLVNRSLT